MSIFGSQKSLRKPVFGCEYLAGLSAIGMGIFSIVMVLLGLFGDRPSQDIAVTSLGATYEMHDRIETGLDHVVVVKLNLTGTSVYRERVSSSGNREGSKYHRELAFTIPIHLKVFDANSGKLLHEHTQLLGYDRKKKRKSPGKLLHCHHEDCANPGPRIGTFRECAIRTDVA